MLFYSTQQYLAQEGFADYLNRFKEEKQIEAKESFLFTRKILCITNSPIGFLKRP